MNKLIISIIACVLTIIPISAQNLSESEVSDTIHRAIELYNGKQYNECYQLSKKLTSFNLPDSKRSIVCSYYINSGCRRALELITVGCNTSDSSQCTQARAILDEVKKYAQESEIKQISNTFLKSWYYEGVICHINENFAEALKCYDNALKYCSILGFDSNKMTILTNIASIHKYLGDYSKSITYYKQALSIAIHKQNDAKQMDILEALCVLCEKCGNIEQKIYYVQQMEILVRGTNDNKARFAYYSYIGDETKKLGRDNIAEQWYFKALQIAKEQCQKSDSTNLHLAYKCLRVLYQEIGRYDDAYKYCQLEIGDDSEVRIDNYLRYIALAKIHLKKGEYDSCKQCLDKLFAIESSIIEPRQLYKIHALQGEYYFNIKEYKSALIAYKKADEILASKYPAIDDERRNLFAMIGSIEHRLGNHNESERYYKLYAETTKAIYKENSLEYINAQINLANAQGFAGHITDGYNSYASAIIKLKKILRNRISYMNTAEREVFMKTISSLITYMTPYALKAKLYQSKYTKICYDALLLSKAFLLDTERSLYDVIRIKGNEEDKQMYLKILSMNHRIKEWERNYAQNSDSILVASHKMALLESNLMQKSHSLGDISSFMCVDYNIVKDVLNENEVLIDFTDFVSKVGDRSGDRYYAAYITNKRQKYPLLKPLFAESQIDSLGIVRPDMFYDKEFAADVIDLLWNPIKEHIAEGSTVYYVPSQMLFQVCLESLPLDDGSLLGEHYNFIRLSSGRELIKAKQSKDKLEASSAVLYGGLQYDLDPNVMDENAKQYDLSSLMVMRGGDVVRGDSIFRELPGSKVEIERISEILKKSKFKVTPYTGANGTEESFLSMHGKSPQILHLATHGFYYIPAEANEVDYLRGCSDAMSLSGLIMSGGNAAWLGKKPSAGTLGGVLTANNIAHLDLSNTDMVVLSACQTGQGKATAEGLYGLQRAFKKAGVGTMVMSLWNASDKVATEFMIRFYEALVENNWDKHKAFNQAKLYIRTQYPDPYRWAVFVMLD